MPCRNAGTFLTEAVASILQQSECLELFVADGGSTDGSLEQLEHLSKKDSRLKLVSRSDMGPADALNKAFKAARGTLSAGSMPMTSTTRSIRSCGGRS